MANWKPSPIWLDLFKAHFLRNKACTKPNSATYLIYKPLKIIAMASKSTRPRYLPNVLNPETGLLGSRSGRFGEAGSIVALLKGGTIENERATEPTP